MDRICQNPDCGRVIPAERKRTATTCDRKCNQRKQSRKYHLRKKCAVCGGVIGPEARRAALETTTMCSKRCRRKKEDRSAKGLPIADKDQPKSWSLSRKRKLVHTYGTDSTQDGQRYPEGNAEWIRLAY